MREIKFKRYYKNDETGEVVSRIWGCVDYRSESSTDFLSFASPSYVHGFRPIADCQFTGLLDRNKKEGYEGDVIERESPFNSNKRVRGVIVFSNGAFRVDWCVKREGNWNDVLHLHLPESEIVGNIHDNPEFSSPQVRRETPLSYG